MSAKHQNPWARFSPGSVVAYGGEQRTVGKLAYDVGVLSSFLRATRQKYAVVSCDDRYHLTVSLFSLWQNGMVAVLPSHSDPETIPRTAGHFQTSLVLCDGSVPGTDIRAVLGGGAEAPALKPDVAEDQLLAIVHTSGSTGQPKSCAKTCGQLFGEVQTLAATFHLPEQTRVFCTVSSQHVYGLLFGLLLPVLNGGALARATPRHAEAVIRELRDHRAQVLCGAPVHLAALAALDPWRAHDLRRIFSSGAPLEEITARWFWREQCLPVTEVLGSSETGGIAYRENHGSGGAWSPLSGVKVGSGPEGTIEVDSPFLAPGSPRPFRGADRIALAEGGRFEHLGRSDGIVKIGGIRVSVADVESRLRDVPGVRQAAVLVKRSAPPRDAELWAAVMAEDLTPSEIRSRLRRVMSSAAVPRRILVVSALPRDPNGKVSNRALEDLFATAELPAASSSGGTFPVRPDAEG